MGDRRDSPRIPIRLLVREVEAGGSFEEREGDISVGGVYYSTNHQPAGRKVELRFRLGGEATEIRCEGEVLRVTENDGRFGAHVRFGELETQTELAIARFIDDHELGKG